MKKLSVLFLMAVLALSVSPVYAGDISCNETVLDKAWDWGTTLGKSGLDKEVKLAGNQAERAQRCAEKIAKKAQKEANKAAGDMKKKFGL